MDNAKCSHPRTCVHDEEVISRFIFDEKHIKKKTQAVFKPPANGSFSTYRITRKKEQEVWNISEKYVEPYIKGDTVGRVDLFAKDYVSEGLEFDPDGKPHTRHTNIVGWNPHKPDDLDRRLSLVRRGNWKEKNDL